MLCTRILSKQARSLHRTAPCRTLTTATFPPAQSWSRPSTNALVPDEEINGLASSPRRPLTLADLVKLVAFVQSNIHPH